MTGSRPAIALIVGLLVLCLGGTAQAQDLWEGKSAQQLFRLNCAACHRSPAGLARAGEKAGGLFGLETFLSQHYTASGRSAQIIANYLKSVDSAAERRRTRRPGRRVTRPRKPAAAKPDPAKKSDSAKKSDAATQTDTAKASEKATEKTSDQPDKMKSEADKAEADAPKADAAKASDDQGGASEADEPKMTAPKPDKKEPAAPTTEAKRETPKAAADKPAGGDADKKTN